VCTPAGCVPPRRALSSAKAMSRKLPTQQPKKKRLSLLERQQALLEEQGFSKPPTQTATAEAGRGNAARGRHYGRSVGFVTRQERHLTRQGRHNATSTSRRRAALPVAADGDEGGGGLDDAVSAAGSAMSHMSTGSMHPSLTGTSVSLACSEVTIGVRPLVLFALFDGIVTIVTPHCLILSLDRRRGMTQPIVRENVPGDPPLK
jgi:hypothetical protein